MGLARESLLSTRRWLIPGPLIALVIVALILSVTLPGTGEIVGLVSLFVGYLAVAALAMRRSRRLEPRERQAWRYFAAATLLTALGVLAFGLWSALVGDLPAFGPLDVFFLVSYLMMLLAVIHMARIDSGGSNWVRTLLDALVGGIALTALVWAAFLHDLLEASIAPGWQTVIGLSYPVLDIAIVVGLIIMVIRRSHYHLDMRLVFLAAGMTAQVLSDFVYFNRGVGRTFAEARPAWSVLLVAMVFLLLAAVFVDVVPKRREFPEQGTPVWALLWPYLLVSALLAMHVVQYRSAVIDPTDVVLLDALLAIGVVVFFRQVLEIKRNRETVETQRSELVASVSHELRTPLTGIVGYLTLLTNAGDEFPEDARREMTREAEGEARHMSRLVNDLVMVARGTNSALPVEIEEVPISTIITAALRNVDAGETWIDEEVDGDILVRVDADRIQQALTNLLSNAVRYGGDRVIVSSSTDAADLVIEVHDNGPGVPTRFQSVIWQRFERGANRLNASAPGLGIGLAIVQAVAESHGGTTHYRPSERLGGSCFAMTIPGCASRRPAPSERLKLTR